MMFLLRPVEGINYNFILGMYSVFLVLGAIFLILELTVDVQAIKGLYLIFVPFLPATLWCLIVRRRWLLEKGSKQD
ncbi:hypothetical protein CTAYLR_002974 [Chrysophaeum taylorii]|uniref:Uncharacterized protein n=1 Tax=Chrysophaeum taylorii TaxID=2483200 RepID=A0AAD7U5Z7_9STRA|nr:hypothetical protein CTAYLR_002974 [Chrysophaeum taylorii]